MACAPSEDSDQPGHPPSLIRVFAVRLRTRAFFMQTAKTLIRLGGCPGWSESTLGAHAILLVLSCRGSFSLCLQYVAMPQPAPAASAANFAQFKLIIRWKLQHYKLPRPYDPTTPDSGSMIILDYGFWDHFVLYILRKKVWATTLTIHFF